MIPNGNAPVGAEESASTRKYGRKLFILPPNDQIKELQTILRDK